MKYKKLIAAILPVLLLLLGGCSLAKQGQAAGDDRLIGVLVTKGHLDLFDSESFIRDNADRLINGTLDRADTSEYQGRLWAVLKSRELTDTESGEKSRMLEYTFEGVDGIGFYVPRMTENGEEYLGSVSDEGISEGHVSISESDSGTYMELTGVIYVRPGSGSQWVMNCVYQTPEGEVYAVSGNGVAADLDAGAVAKPGASVGFSCKEEHSRSGSGGETGTAGCSVSVSIAALLPPETLELTEMGADGMPVERREFSAQSVPESLSLSPDCEYVIVTQSAGGSSTHTVVDRDGSLEFYRDRGDGVCVMQQVELDWS